jgi:hypothetical protein
LSDTPAAQQSGEAPTAHVGMSIEQAVSAMQADQERAKAPTPEESQPEAASPEASDPLAVDSSDGGVEQVEAAEATEEVAAPEDPDTKDPVYRLEIDGEERDLTAEQLTEAVMLKADYTRKTQALAEQRRAVEQAAQQINSVKAEAAAERQRYIERGQQYDQALQALVKLTTDGDNEFASIDWEALEAEDPVEAGKKWRRYQQNEQRKSALQAETQRRATEQAELSKAQLAEAQQQLATVWLERHPEWKDPEVGRKGWGQITHTLSSLGFRQDEIAQTLDPRVMELAHKAAKYDALQSAKSSATAVPPKARTEAPRPITVVRPGAPRPSSARTARATEVAALAAKAKSSGSLMDVYALQQAQRQNAARR